MVCGWVGDRRPGREQKDNSSVDGRFSEASLGGVDLEGREEPGMADCQQRWPDTPGVPALTVTTGVRLEPSLPPLQRSPEINRTTAHWQILSVNIRVAAPF